MRSVAVPTDPRPTKPTRSRVRSRPASSTIRLTDRTTAAAVVACPVVTRGTFRPASAFSSACP